MTERKFTPPTKFPAEYVTRAGDKAVIVGTMPNDAYPYLGYAVEGDTACETSWDKRGRAYEWSDDIFHSDIFDIVPEPQKQVPEPQKQAHWANDYGYSFQNWWPTREAADDNAGSARIAVIRREWVEGQLPQYFTEGV